MKHIIQHQRSGLRSLFIQLTQLSLILLLLISCAPEAESPRVQEAIDSITSGALAEEINQTALQNKQVKTREAKKDLEQARLTAKLIPEIPEVLGFNEFPLVCEFDVPKLPKKEKEKQKENKELEKTNTEEKQNGLIGSHDTQPIKAELDADAKAILFENFFGGTPSDSFTKTYLELFDISKAKTKVDPERNYVLEVLLGRCIRKIFEKPIITFKVIETMKRYAFSLPVDKLSKQSSEDLQKYVARGEKLSENPITDIFDPSKLLRSMIRRSYEEKELLEISALAFRLKDELNEASQLLTKYFEKRGAEFKDAYLNSRYQAIKLVLESVDPKIRSKKISDLHLLLAKQPIMFQALMSLPLSSFPTFGILALVPEKGWETFGTIMELSEENPFEMVFYPQYHLGYSEHHTKRAISLYTSVQKAERNALAVPRAKLAPNPVRVALIDSGVDLIQYAHYGLNTFMSQSEKGRLRTYDHADFDTNVHLPEIGTLGHGTVTLGTLLHVLGQIDSKLLNDKRLDVGFWKVFSSKSFLGLGSISRSASYWETHPFPLISAIHDAAKGHKNHPNPDVVSVSMVFKSYHLLKVMDVASKLKDLDTLWVMSAGNDGVPIQTKKTGCFSDFPKEDRPVDKIICVGALTRGYGTDLIAAYSTHGPEVDLYTYETFNPTCPAGTSCSAPAISAFALSIKAKYPSLKAEEIKSAIMAASVKKRVLVDPEISASGQVVVSPSDLTAGEYREINVVNPLDHQMRAVAFEAAKMMTQKNKKTPL